MDQFLEFFGNHVVLFGVLFGILGALVWTFIGGGSTQRISPAGATRLINDQDALVLDVRSDGEFSEGHVVNAMNIPLASLAERTDKLEKYRKKPILPICANGSQATSAAKTLRQKGFEQMFAVTGGIAAWRDASLPLTKK